MGLFICLSLCVQLYFGWILQHVYDASFYVIDRMDAVC